MSISIILLPLSIALSTSMQSKSTDTKQLREIYQKSTNNTLPPIETIFNDITILKTTLEEHGLPVFIVSNMQLHCQIGDVLLDYSRKNTSEPFMVTISGLDNIEIFLDELECFEREYKQNVQSYTYNTLIKNINKTNLVITEECILEDDSILLTIDV